MGKDYSPDFSDAEENSILNVFLCVVVVFVVVVVVVVRGRNIV